MAMSILYYGCSSLMRDYHSSLNNDTTEIARHGTSQVKSVSMPIPPPVPVAYQSYLDVLMHKKHC